MHPDALILFFALGWQNILQCIAISVLSGCFIANRGTYSFGTVGGSNGKTFCSAALSSNALVEGFSSAAILVARALVLDKCSMLVVTQQIEEACLKTLYAKAICVCTCVCALAISGLNAGFKGPADDRRIRSLAFSNACFVVRINCMIRSTIESKPTCSTVKK